MSKNTPSAIDLFAGAGGISEGLRQSGFAILAASEIESTFAQTHRYNHPDTVMFDGDIRDLKTKPLMSTLGIEKGQLDLLAGGPPCQGFSINAPTRTMNDKRNHLFFEFLRIVKGLCPKVILIENVPGLISMNQGQVVSEIYKALDSLGYKTNHMILYAAHYGVPQMRWRTIFLASRKDIAVIPFPHPTHYAKGRANFTGSKDLCFKLPDVDDMFADKLLQFTNVRDAISDLPELGNGEGSEEGEYNCKPGTLYQKRLREKTAVLWNHQSPNLHPINLERLKFIKPGGSWRDLPHDLLPKGLTRARRSDHTRRYGRLDPKGLATTIMTKCDPHWGSFFHYGQDRAISVREAARLQSFPDNFRFLGALVQQYQQVGNAVPPMLVKVLGDRIREVLDSSLNNRSAKSRRSEEKNNFLESSI